MDRNEDRRRRKNLMKQYSKAIVAVLGCIVSIAGWQIDEGLISSLASVITAILVYAVPNIKK